MMDFVRASLAAAALVAVAFLSFLFFLAWREDGEFRRWCAEQGGVLLEHPDRTVSCVKKGARVL